MQRTHFAVLASASALAFALAACEKKPAAATVPAAGSTPAGAHPTNADAGHDHGHDHDHDHDHDHGDHHGGAAVDLGSATIGGFTAKVTRDEGAIVAGKDAAIDVTVTPAAGSAAKVVAVRFWIGVEGAKGSVKAKGEIEDPKEPTRWHAHAAVPSPLPAGSKLWVEIENDKGELATGGLDLRM